MRTRTAIRGLGGAAALWLGCAAAGHAQPGPAEPAGGQAQAAAGARLYMQGIPGKAPPCAACHGAQGQGVAPYPRLAGLPAPYLAAQMNAYRDGKRPNAVMQTFARTLSQPQIEAVADYAASLTGPYLPAPRASAATLTAGARLIALGKWSAGVPACRDCHGPALAGGGAALPALAGQPQAYLLGQLEAFKAGTRPGGPLDLMARVAKQLDAGEMRAAAAYAASLRANQEAAIPRGEKSDWQPRAQDPDDFTPPPESALPAKREDAAAVVLGENIFMDTPKYAPQYAGNALSCRNCHTDRGRNPLSSPMWAAVPQYPKYRSKNRTVNTLSMRIAGCFRYSENGTPPPAESREMVALISYMHWLATGLPSGIKPKASGYRPLAAPQKAPDRTRGKAVYAANCAVCHGADGQGSESRGSAGGKGSTAANTPVIPPLWGPHSFNWGAGMHGVDKAAAFIHANMPFGATGVLSEQQAWDVAAWIDSQPRPQDPRFTGSVEKTRALYHAHHQYDYYGKQVDGRTLGAR